MEKLVIKVNRKESTRSAWKPVMVSSEMFKQIEELTSITGKRKCDIVDMLLKFAIKNLEIEEDQQKWKRNRK